MKVIKRINVGRDFVNDVVVLPTKNPDIFFVQVTANRKDNPREYCTIYMGGEGDYQTLTAILYEEGKDVKASTDALIEAPQAFLIPLSNKDGRGWFEGFLIINNGLLDGIESADVKHVVRRDERQKNKTK